MVSMFDHIMSVIDVLLLMWIVAQGEAIRFYEREVHRMAKERFEERAKWREQKRLQQTKKSESPKTSGSEKSLESPSKIENVEPTNKTTSAKSAVVPSTRMDIPA
jgi:hypothetical protein